MLKKILALLTCMLLLCVCLPLGAVSVADAATSTTPSEGEDNRLQDNDGNDPKRNPNIVWGYLRQRMI